VAIEMTLTTPGCPLHASIEADVKRVLGAVPGVEGVTVELVWEPPWTPAAMSDRAKRALGFW
jgi:metal-sulfur cluster biosynthetic enzyme